MTDIYEWLKLVAANTHNSDRDRCAAWLLSNPETAQAIAQRLGVDDRELVLLYFGEIVGARRNWRQRYAAKKFLASVAREYRPLWRSHIQPKWERLDRLYFEDQCDRENFVWKAHDQS